MKPEKAAKIVNSTIAELDEVLRADNWMRDPKTRERFKHEFRGNWVRDLGWKMDIIGISYPIRYSSIMYAGHVMLHAEINLPCSDERLGECLNGTTIEYLARRKNGYFIPLSVFHVFFPNRFKNKIVHDVCKAVPWFESYDTPQKCLDILESGITVWGDKIGPARQVITKYLEELIETGSWK